jgi:hypothetical protein
LLSITNFYQHAYRKWAKANNFDSMLPEDTKKRRAAVAEETLRQSQVHEHFDKAKPEDKPKVYTDEIFKEAAIQWLIETDQVCTTVSGLNSLLMISNSLFKLSNTLHSKT